MDIIRTDALKRLRLLLQEYPVVALLGARQVGKTTLARQLAAKRTTSTWFDLEDPADLARLDDPGLELRPLKGLVVLDEIHRLPDIFPLLRVLADRPGTPARFLVLGSASPELLRQTSETLAGRVAFCRLDGFTTNEVDDVDRLWVRGGFPRSYLARSEAASVRWRYNFVDTFLSRDVPDLGGSVPPATLRRFWTMLAHWHGQTWNGAEFGRAFGVAHTTVRRYLDLMTSLFVVRQLPPWFENISKRQVRSPKVYVADSGILHALLGLPSRAAIVSHPKVGASWEGFVVSQGDRTRRRPSGTVFPLVHPQRRRVGPARRGGRASTWIRGQTRRGTHAHAFHAFVLHDPETGRLGRDPCRHPTLPTRHGHPRLARSRDKHRASPVGEVNPIFSHTVRAI